MGKTFFQPEATQVTGLGVLGNPWILLLFWLLLINLVTFLVFGLDKWKAKCKAKNEAVRRVPEKTLLLLAILGGSVGAILGMRVFHHKTLHRRFRYGLPAILVLQLALATWIAWRVLAH